MIIGQIGTYVGECMPGQRWDSEELKCVGITREEIYGKTDTILMILIGVGVLFLLRKV